MNIPVKKYRELVEKLFLSTNNNKLNWQIHPFTDDLYTMLGKSTITISSGEDAEGDISIKVSIKNYSDEEVDWFTDNTITGGLPSIPGRTSYWALLNDLYTMAYRRAKGADEALDEILAELGDDEPLF